MLLNPISNHTYITIRKMHTFFIKIHTFLKTNYIHLFRVSRDPNHPYYILNSHLGTSRSDFLPYPTSEKFRTNFGKIGTSLRKMDTSIPRRTQTYISLTMPIFSIGDPWEVIKGSPRPQSEL